VVLTSSDELLEQVGQVLDQDGEVRHAETEAEARQCVAARHAVVMLVDAREQVDPGLTVERLHASDGSTVIVVFAPEASVADVARAIRGSSAFAVLPIPLETEKTRAVLQGAGEEALARRALVTPIVESKPSQLARVAAAQALQSVPDLPAVVRQLSDTRREPAEQPGSAVLPAAGGKTPRAAGVPRVALIAAACLLFAGAAAWYYLRDTGDSPEQQATTAATRPADPGTQPIARPVNTPTAGDPEQLATASREELLDRARVAFHERRYSDPQGDNALYFYRSVLAQDPQDAEAREGLDRIGAVLDGRLKSALAEQRTADAERTLQQLRLIRPDDPALAAAEARMVESRIGAALARGDVAQANALLATATASGMAPERLAAQRTQLARLESAQRAEQLARIVGDRISAGQLLDPVNDSAKYHLGQLLALPNGKRIGADTAAELAQAFAERGRRAAEQGQGAEADRWFAEASAIGYKPERTMPAPTTAAATTPVAAATPSPTQPTATRVVEQRSDPVAAQGPRSEPTTAATARPQASPADFKRTRFVPPTYPQQALARRQEGEVRVRITVDTTGRVAEAVVESATPPGVFDQAALSAVRKWRYEPIVKGGQPIGGSIVTAIRFEPEQPQR
jgi:TonB family protein